MSHAAHDLEALRLKSHVNDETGCWEVRVRAHNGSYYVWSPLAGKTLSLTAAMAWLMTGKPSPAGKMWVAVCGNNRCGNPAHRKLGTRSLLMKVMRPRLDPLHRARIQVGQLRRSSLYSAERRNEIMQSDETCAALGQRLGIHPSTVHAVRSGKRWARMAPAASVFNLAALS